MADAIIKAGIQINAQVGGGEQIDKLVKTIAETSDETSQLSQAAQKLAQEWQKAQQNQALIEHYKTVKNSLVENRQEIAHTEQQLHKLYVQMSDGKTKQQEQQFNQLKEKLVQLNQQKRALSENLRKASLSMNDAGIATKHLANNQKYFADQAQKAEQKLKELNQQAQKVQQIAQSKAILGMDVDDRARQEIAALDKAFADLKRNGGLSQAELARAAQLHAQKVGEIEQSLQRVKPTLGEVAQAVGGLASQATGLTYLAKQAMNFETAMASVKKVTDGTPEQYEKLSSEIKKMAGELGVLPAELAEIAAAGGQANVALEELPKFTRMAAEMAVAFKIPAEQAGDMAAKIGNVFQIPIDKVGELMDAVNVLGNNTAAKEAEISDVLMRIGGNAKQFGLVAEEAAALGAAFISLGKTPEVAGTAINALLTKLQTSTEQGADFKNSLKDIGLSAQEMADNIAANPQAALTDFLQRIEQLDKQSRSIVLSKMFGAEYSDDLALLAGSLKTYEDALAHATDKAKTLGAMQAEVNKSLQTTESKINQAKSAMSSAALFSGRQTTDLDDLLHNHTYYNGVRMSDYPQADGYLDGLEITSQSYADLLPEWIGRDKVLFLFDPPYVCTAQGAYRNETYFGMVEFLKLMRLVRPPFVFFSSTRSEFLDYLDLVIGYKLDGWERFAGYRKINVQVHLNKNAKYEDNLVYKF